MASDVLYFQVAFDGHLETYFFLLFFCNKILKPSWYGFQNTSFICFSYKIQCLYSIDDCVQDCSISSALAMELLQSCTKPSLYYRAQQRLISRDAHKFIVLCNVIISYIISNKHGRHDDNIKIYWVVGFLFHGAMLQWWLIAEKMRRTYHHRWWRHNGKIFGIDGPFAIVWPVDSKRAGNAEFWCILW